MAKSKNTTKEKVKNEPLVEVKEESKESTLYFFYTQGCGWCAFSEWALRSVDAGFPISDHSDFSGTMKFVEECNPKQVYTVHGSTKELAKEITKQLGINAQPLPKYGQASIEKYN